MCLVPEEATLVLLTTALFQMFIGQLFIMPSTFLGKPGYLDRLQSTDDLVF